MTKFKPGDEVNISREWPGRREADGYSHGTVSFIDHDIARVHIDRYPSPGYAAYSIDDKFLSRVDRLAIDWMVQDD